MTSARTFLKLPAGPALTRAARGILSGIREVEGQFGAGGRASNAGIKVAVFGATGFLGRYVCNKLGECGTTTYIANRGCEMETRHLRPMFDLGMAAYYFYNGKDTDSIKAVMEGADVCINMVGKRYETKHLVPTDSNGRLDILRGSRVNYSFSDVNVGVSGTIAQVAKECGVSRLIHVSAHGASPDATSEQLKTKFEGEEVVKSWFPEATIIRPATMFGWEDWFLNANAWMNERLQMQILCEDGNGMVQPVYVDDVAQAIHKAVPEENPYIGKTLALAGPAEYTRAEIAAFVKDVVRSQRPIVPVPKPLLALGAKVTNQLTDPFLTPDDVELWSTNLALDEQAAKASGHVLFEDMGIEATPMEKVAFSYLHRYRIGGHFTTVQGYH